MSVTRFYLQDLLPGIINQLGPDNLEHLKTISQQYQVLCVRERTRARVRARSCVHLWESGIRCR